MHRVCKGDDVPRSSKAQSVETRKRLVAVARGLFAEHGYAGVSLEQVAEEAGLTRGAVYHHFAGKQGLFEAVLRDAQAMIADAVAAAAPGDDWQSVIDGCTAYLRAADDPAVRRIVVVDGPAVVGWDAWRQGDAESSAMLLAEGLSALDDLAVDATLAAALLNGAVNEAALWIARGGDAQLVETALQRLVGSLRQSSDTGVGPRP